MVGQSGHLHNITLSRRRRRPTTMTMCSNDTLVDTPFKLISGFFHVNKVFSVVQQQIKEGGATGKVRLTLGLAQLATT